MVNSKNRISSIGTVGAFINGRACSDTLFHVLNRAYGHPLKTEEKAAMPLAGGIMQNGYQCGMIWGSALAAGAQAFRLFGQGTKAETGAILAAQKIVESFRNRNREINCLELTDIDKSSSKMKMISYFLIKGGTIKCFRMAARYAPVAYEAINDALTGDGPDAPSAPVSCSALLLQKSGASAFHAAMAAGLAGGIGLCGGACGALGAAIWFLGVKRFAEGTGKLEFQSPRAQELVERFLKSSNYEFECSEITGRRFKDVRDHAGFLHEGGCSKIIETLAADLACNPHQDNSK